MTSQRLTRRQMLTMCGMVLAVGAVAPQAVAAGGGGKPITDTYVAPGVTAAVISFNTVMARDATLVLWSDDVPQSYRALDDPSVTTFHSFKCASLQPDTAYHYEIRLHDTPDDSFVAFASVLHTRRPMPQNAAAITLPDGRQLSAALISIDDVDLVTVMTDEGWVLSCLFSGGTGPAVGTSFSMPVPTDAGTLEQKDVEALSIDRHVSDVLPPGTYVTMEQWIASGDFTPLPARTVAVVGVPYVRDAWDRALPARSLAVGNL